MTIKLDRVAPRRGDIYLVNFDPTIGSEIKKTRPAVIIQNDIGNQYSTTTIVSAITSQGLRNIRAPVSVVVPKGYGSLTNDSVVLLSQIRTVDKQRLGKFLGSLPAKIMRQIDQQLKISLDV